MHTWVLYTPTFLPQASSMETFTNRVAKESIFLECFRFDVHFDLVPSSLFLFTVQTLFNTKLKLET